MRSWLRIGAALLAASLSCQAQEKPSPQQVAWLAEHAVAFETAQAGNGFDDLKAFGEMVGEARIVSLGEGTHGTREFFQMKHRLTEYLASEKGFTIFSIEANMPEAYRLNDYVLGGEGDPKELIAGMYFWTWNTQEVLQMVEWMRRFNQSGQGRIEFTGFDMQFPGVAAQNVLAFLSAADPQLYDRLAPEYRKVGDVPQASSGFSVLTFSFPVQQARGKKLRYSGYIKSEGLQDGYAGLWWRVDGEGGKILAFDNMSDRGPRGDSDWTRYQIELEIPQEAVNINFGALMPGSGKAWFDSLKIELDGLDQGDSGFDLGFEGEALRAFHQGALLDRQVKHSGQQSLRLERNTDSQQQQETKQKAVELAQQALQQMESSKERLAQSQGLEETEWAIQNARVVRQSLLLRNQAAGAARDKSMAENVRWILEQNPSAKIVLWAHNGHVWRHPQAMGGQLAEWYGGSYLPVGFAAAKGQYYAMPGRSAPPQQRVHDLQPPLPNSYESCFLATGQPRLILDLRLAQSGGAGSDWLSSPRLFRSIGALAMENQFFQVSLTRMFDVLIYFEDTSPAVQLTGTRATPR